MSLGQLPEHVHLGFITYAKDVSYYSALSKNLGVDHRIHYVLDIDWTEVLSWIKAADFGIIPYQVTSDNAFAASPNKMYEFATAGVPIIATSNLPRVKTFVEKYQIGITHPFSDASSYAQGIAWRDEMGGNTAPIARKFEQGRLLQMTIPKMQRNFLRHIKKVVELMCGLVAILNYSRTVNK